MLSAWRLDGWAAWRLGSWAAGQPCLTLRRNMPSALENFTKKLILIQSFLPLPMPFYTFYPFSSRHTDEAISFYINNTKFIGHDRPGWDETVKIQSACGREKASISLRE